MGSSGGPGVVLRRTAPVLGALGGLCFFGYWFVRARDLTLSPVAGALLDVATFVLLCGAFLGHLLEQDLVPVGWVGWAGLTALLQGLLFSPPAVCFGLVLLGISIARSGAHHRVPGVLLAASGLALLWTFYDSSGFGRAHAEMGTLGRAVMGAALIGVAASLTDLFLPESGPNGRVGAPHHAGRV